MARKPHPALEAFCAIFSLALLALTLFLWGAKAQRQIKHERAVVAAELARAAEAEQKDPAK
jgi:Flp pilus assembly protein TadB